MNMNLLDLVDKELNSQPIDSFTNEEYKKEDEKINEGLRENAKKYGETMKRAKEIYVC